MSEDREWEGVEAEVVEEIEATLPVGWGRELDGEDCLF